MQSDNRPLTYALSVAGLTRDLPICPLSDDLSIAGFVMFGDVELTRACAEALIKRAPEHDIMITAESKGIPLCYEMARQMGVNRYLIARKGAKVYMKDVFTSEVQSITTRGIQQLCLDRTDADAIRGRRVLIVDDVISTGESVRAVENLVLGAGGTVVGRLAVLAEGDAASRTDIDFLATLPLFNPDGTPIG